MGTDCKSVGDAFVGSNPTLPTIKQALVPNEQPKNQIRPRSSAAEHFFGKEEVTGSILVEGSSFSAFVTVEFPKWRTLLDPNPARSIEEQSKRSSATWVKFLRTQLLS